MQLLMKTAVDHRISSGILFEDEFPRWKACLVAGEHQKCTGCLFVRVSVHRNGRTVTRSATVQSTITRRSERSTRHQPSDSVKPNSEELVLTEWTAQRALPYARSTKLTPESLQRSGLGETVLR